MIFNRMVLLNIAAAGILACVFAGCASAPSSGAYVPPDPYVQKVELQEAISRQQRSLMDF